MRAFATLFTLTLLALVLASACTDGSPSDEPSGVVREFHERLAIFDTAGMIELVCEENREEVETGVSLLQTLFGTSAFLGADVGEMTLEDYHVVTVAGGEVEAAVEVQGRLNAGPPMGSTTIDHIIILRKEGDGWCLLDSGVVAKADPEEPTVELSQEGYLEGEESGRLLLQTVEGPERCVVARVPLGWDYGRSFGLGDKGTAYCPGGEALVTQGQGCAYSTQHKTLIDISRGGSLQEGWAYLELTFHTSECQDLEQFAASVIEEEGVEPAGRFREEERTLAGTSARCLEYSYSAVGGEAPVVSRDVHEFRCYFLVSGGLYGWQSVALESDWEEVGPVVEDIMSSLELHPVDR